MRQIRRASCPTICAFCCLKSSEMSARIQTTGGRHDTIFARNLSDARHPNDKSIGAAHELKFQSYDRRLRRRSPLARRRLSLSWQRRADRWQKAREKIGDAQRSGCKSFRLRSLVVETRQRSISPARAATATADFVAMKQSARLQTRERRST